MEFCLYAFLGTVFNVQMLLKSETYFNTEHFAGIKHSRLSLYSITHKEHLRVFKIIMQMNNNFQLNFGLY